MRNNLNHSAPLQKLWALSLLVMLALPSYAQEPQARLDVHLQNNDQREQLTRDQLLRLIAEHNVAKWIFTKKITIAGGRKVVPHSHPVLTLNTRHIKDDELLLATFIHEQLHWFIDSHPSKQAAYERLKALYPDPPARFPEGSGGITDTYYHIIICYLEFKALQQLLGELKAWQVIKFWQQDHYRWIYSTVLEDRYRLEELVQDLDLDI
ncbi:hypothetical protein [Chitinophaga japonensis]|uniref:SprT-like family protein n=1 Tax=Chitinophaga japonensis TaxID=104662 RepID=A0A562TCX2_CHIJA|nr:hypothetical protein [Chitinophaga japonensis]TWI90926.1 hypothetical protein LX66_0287 [Chitinophaga japonensis]